MARVGALQLEVSMDAADLSALSALSGSAIGALASLGTTWLARRYQDRNQQIAQERARRERFCGEFIAQASTMFADALSQTSREDPARLVPLYATGGMLRPFAAERTVAAADAVLARIVEIYYLPNMDFTARPSPQDGDFDIFRDFTAACRAELRG
jgi:hypothetical protein